MMSETVTVSDILNRVTELEAEVIENIGALHEKAQKEKDALEKEINTHRSYIDRYNTHIGDLPAWVKFGTKRDRELYAASLTINPLTPNEKERLVKAGIMSEEFLILLQDEKFQRIGPKEYCKQFNERGIGHDTYNMSYEPLLENRQKKYKTETAYANFSLLFGAIGLGISINDRNLQLGVAIFCITGALLSRASAVWESVPSSFPDRSGYPLAGKDYYEVSKKIEKQLNRLDQEKISIDFPWHKIPGLTAFHFDNLEKTLGAAANNTTLPTSLSDAQRELSRYYNMLPEITKTLTENLRSVQENETEPLNGIKELLFSKGDEFTVTLDRPLKTLSPKDLFNAIKTATVNQIVINYHNAQRELGPGPSFIP